MTAYHLTHLKQLEAESIHIIREVAAEFERPMMLYSVGKDSAVMLQLALKAFFPGKLPFKLLHVHTTWKFRDRLMRELGLELIVHTNQEGVRKGVNPFTYGSKRHTDIMKTEALKQALDKYRFDAAFGGARYDEEKSRAKESPVVQREGTWIMVDNERMPLEPDEKPQRLSVRFRTLGCYPLTGAVESTATTLPEIIREMLLATTSARQGWVIDHDQSGSMEQKKREGYF